MLEFLQKNGAIALLIVCVLLLMSVVYEIAYAPLALAAAAIGVAVVYGKHED